MNNSDYKIEAEVKYLSHKFESLTPAQRLQALGRLHSFTRGPKAAAVLRLSLYLLLLNTVEDSV